MLNFFDKNPYGADVRITHGTPSIRVNLVGKCLSAKVYILGIEDFDVILGMD